MDRKKVLHWIKANYRILTAVFSVVFIISTYMIMRFAVTHDRTAWSHLMYIPIITAGSLLGPWGGIVMGIMAGIVAGPLMPISNDPWVPQFWGDWVFRMLMMIFAGLISGGFGVLYQRSRNQIDDLSIKNMDSGLLNISALEKMALEKGKIYTLASVIIANYDSICEVSGYHVYYAYLKDVEKRLKSRYPDLAMIQASHHHLWILKPSSDFLVEIQVFLDIFHQASQMDEQHLFVDYSMGFFLRKHVQETKIANYFIQPDMAAKEARNKNLTHMIYSDFDTNRQFEYELLADFQTSLYDGSIYLVYQPKIDFKTKKPSGLEALIRWDHPTKKLIRPDQFIGAVEKTNMIHEMTQQVFRWSLAFQKKLNEKGVFLPISINVSTRNLYDEAFFSKMMAILKEYDIKPKYVELELTETVLMDNPEMSKKALELFANEGFRIAIDDFGKGYSSLAYLAQFPINIIKIDRIFTRQILINPTTQHIVKATIDLAKQLGYEVLIEGIEDKETSDLLERLGCQSAQGYYYMRPKKEDEILTYLLQYK
ncbi:MAG: EAL domain-containing protein [Acholeplasma sp.]|jgi:EAL domain-containing protein (putative c-di-GMP-specific phosphodiesterase class I)|nr:MAG: EAL domain-containing protein [Acholeplasma sp.]